MRNWFTTSLRVLMIAFGAAAGAAGADADWGEIRAAALGKHFRVELPHGGKAYRLELDGPGVIDDPWYICMVGYDHSRTWLFGEPQPRVQISIGIMRRPLTASSIEDVVEFRTLMRAANTRASIGNVAREVETTSGLSVGYHVEFRQGGTGRLISETHSRPIDVMHVLVVRADYAGRPSDDSELLRR
jgi:hypothetical protein